MKKLGVTLLFIVGFIAVFLISGYISYQTFESKYDEGGENSGEIAENASANENNAPMMTIVTPGLNEGDTVVSYGGEAELYAQSSSRMSADIVIEEDDEEIEVISAPVSVPVSRGEDNGANADADTQPRAENPVREETAPVAEAPQTVAEPTVEEPAEEAEAEQPQEEPAVVETPQEETPQVELNPNIQTSDSGI